VVEPQFIQHGFNDSTGEYEFRLGPVQEAFLEWLVDPDPKKGSQAEWGRRHDVGATTLQRWKKNRVFRAELEKRLAQLNVSPDRLQAIVDTLHRQAVGGDTRSAELYMRYVEKLQPTRVVVVDRSVSELSDAELKERIRLLSGFDE